ncbi:MAG: sulfur carrier protein ThiS [Bacteroidota bacterium]
MTIFINDEPTEFEQPPTIIDILAKLQIFEVQGIAIAINDEVIRKADWQEISLNQNDRLMLIRATQGG